MPAAWAERLEALLKSATPPGPDRVNLDDALQALGELAVFVWSMQKRAAADSAMDARLVRAIDRATTRLENLGIVVRDFTGQRFVQGWAVDVRVYQPTSGLNHEMVADTLRPAVFFQSQHIVRADLVVNVPLEPRLDPST